MKQLRTFIAVLVIVFIALPVLFGMTWAVGLTQAVISPDFISEMPKEIIAETRSIVDELVRLGKTDDRSLDPESRAWLKAMASLEKTPSQILDESGVTQWLETELDGSLKQISAILRGDAPAAPVQLNMVPLKQALLSPAMNGWVQGVLSNLPECDENGNAEWRRFMESSYARDHLPPCRPDVAITEEVVRFTLNRAVEDIPDQVEMMNDIEIRPQGMDLARTMSSVTFIMFLIPAIFILLASLLAAGSKSTFFRWAGITTMIGGGLALLSAMAARNVVSWGSWFPHLDFGSRYTPVEVMLVDRLGGLWSVVGSHLITPVIEVAGGVCVVGLILFALSYAFHTGPQSQAPSRPAASTATPESEESKSST